jgi:hypothetical protein
MEEVMKTEDTLKNTQFLIEAIQAKEIYSSSNFLKNTNADPNFINKTIKKLPYKKQF